MSERISPDDPGIKRYKNVIYKWGPNGKSMAYIRRKKGGRKNETASLRSKRHSFLLGKEDSDISSLHVEECSSDNDELPSIMDYPDEQPRRSLRQTTKVYKIPVKEAEVDVEISSGVEITDKDHAKEIRSVPATRNRRTNTERMLPVSYAHSEEDLQTTGTTSVPATTKNAHSPATDPQLTVPAAKNDTHRTTSKMRDDSLGEAQSNDTYQTRSSMTSSRPTKSDRLRTVAATMPQPSPQGEVETDRTGETEKAFAGPATTTLKSTSSNPKTPGIREEMAVAITSAVPKISDTQNTSTRQRPAIRTEAKETTKLAPSTIPRTDPPVSKDLMPSTATDSSNTHPSSRPVDSGPTINPDSTLCPTSGPNKTRRGQSDMLEEKPSKAAKPKSRRVLPSVQERLQVPDVDLTVPPQHQTTSDVATKPAKHTINDPETNIPAGLTTICKSARQVAQPKITQEASASIPQPSLRSKPKVATHIVPTDTPTSGALRSKEVSKSSNSFSEPDARSMKSDNDVKSIASTTAVVARTARRVSFASDPNPVELPSSSSSPPPSLGKEDETFLSMEPNLIEQASDACNICGLRMCHGHGK